MFPYLVDFKGGRSFGKGQDEHRKKGQNKLEHGLLL
jgi:hypothetical protein